MPRFIVTSVKRDPTATYSPVPVNNPDDFLKRTTRHMASFPSMAIDAEWNAMTNRDLKNWIPLTASLDPEQPTLRAEPGDAVTVWKNQANREGIVLAVLGVECLVEYVMPSGSSALYIAVITEPELSISTVPYHKLTKAWRRAVLDGGEVWVGQPQQSRWHSVRLGSDGHVFGVRDGEAKDLLTGPA